MSDRFIVHRSAFIVLIAAVQLWLAHRYFGFLTGDDLEVLEEAFRRATHLPFTPWEVRNLFVPDVVVAPLIWLATKLGVSDVRQLVELASLPFIALTALTIVLVRRLALQWTDGDERAALLAMLLFALHWIPLGFGSTVYPRTLAMACIAGAAVAVERRPLLAGALLGLAFADRFSEIVFLLPLAALCLLPRRGGDYGGGQARSPVHAPNLARDRRWRLSSTGNGRLLISQAGGLRLALLLLAGALLSISVTVGLYDWVTWGSPFRSVIRFAHLTLVEPDFASRVKYQSPLWYVTNLLRWLAPTLLPLFWVARRRVPWLFLLVPFVALSLVKHKELRYTESLIPFVAVAAGIGASMLWPKRRAIAIALVTISLVWSLAGIRLFARKSQPAVLAAQWVAAQHVQRFVTSQLWAYGDRLYLGTTMDLTDLGSPPQVNTAAIARADAVALWETDLDHADLTQALAANGFHPVRTFRDGPARPVVVFQRRP